MQIGNAASLKLGRMGAFFIRHFPTIMLSLQMPLGNLPEGAGVI